MTEPELTQLCDQLSNTPRKYLGRRTPAEVFREKMMEEIGPRPDPRRSWEARFKERAHIHPPRGSETGNQSGKMPGEVSAPSSNCAR